MKISCPSCRKKYNVDQANLPSNVKSARCKACGQLINLDSAASPPSGTQPAILTIACSYCGRNYNLRPDKLPPDKKNFKCKSCGHPVPIKPKDDVKTVHSLKIETSDRLPHAPAPPITGPDSGLQDIVRISCAGCGKRYKIARSKVPPKATAVKCKVCGHKMTLPPAATMTAAGGLLQPEVQPAEAPAAQSDLQPPEHPPTRPRLRRKKWLFALAACIGLVAILGALASRQTLRLDRLYQLFTGKSRQGIESTQLAANKPYLALNLNMPLILDALESRPTPDENSPQLHMMTRLLASMDLKQVELYLYGTPQNQILPVIMAHSSNRRQLEKILNSQKPFNRYFTRRSADSYRLNKDAFEDAAKYSLSQPYEVILIEDGVALTPESLADTIRKTPQALADSPIAGFARDIATPHDMGSLAVRVPEGMNPEWEKNIQNHPAIQSIPQAAAIAGIGSAIVSRMAESLKSLESLALGFRFSGQNERLLTYAQQFKPGVDGEKIYRRLAAENRADPESDPIIRNLIQLFQDHRYRHTLKFKDNRLEINLGWSAQDDEVFLTALTTATIGQLFAGSIELVPSPGAVETRYIPDPDFVAVVDVDRLKSAIPHIIEDGLFPGNFWDSGDNPTMTLDLDTVDIPNASLAELAYEVQAIRTTTGKDVLRAEENKFKPRLLPGSFFPGSISLNILKNTAPDTLDKAIIDFHLSVPVALETFNFKVGDQRASAQEAGGLRVTLDRVEKDVAKVSSSGGKLIRLIAYDQSGKALAAKESISASASAAARFQGVIDTLKVVVVRDMLEYPFEVEVDLNGGKELVLTREAEIPARIRYNHQPIPAYVDFTDEDIQNLRVTWTEGQQDAWSDRLSIRLPKGPFSGNAAWEVHFFGKNKPLVLAGNSAQSEQEVNYTLEKGLLKQVHAAFGKVQLNLHSDIKRLIFFKKEGMQSEIQKLPSGDEVWVAFNQNEITYSTGNAEVIQTAAYDARDNRLKEDPYTRNKANKRISYFWGVPDRFTIDVSTTTIGKLIPFEIKQRPLDEKSYLAYRQLVENQHDVVKTIIAIDRARRSDRTYYGDDLAGLYYLYDQKKKSPMKLISQEVAQSDPAGQKRFGYDVKPYIGYYFSVLSGIETNGVKKSYNRRSKKSSFTWQNGTITTTALTRHPDLVAIPADDSQPTFFLQWGQVLMKPLNGEKLEYLPDGYYNKGWVEAKFIDD
jgi:predicted Zn finger-like uncharacterized protein